MVNGYDNGLVAANILLKDLDTIADVARDTGTPAPMAGMARELFRMLAARGKGEEDPAALVTLYRAG
jgi:3-hydroxyisobutyrate dehydrogenase